LSIKKISVEKYLRDCSDLQDLFPKKRKKVVSNPHPDNFQTVALAILILFSDHDSAAPCIAVSPAALIRNVPESFGRCL
jgi:hypothetical protein